MAIRILLFAFEVVMQRLNRLNSRILYFSVEQLSNSPFRHT